MAQKSYCCLCLCCNRQWEVTWNGERKDVSWRLRNERDFEPLRGRERFHEVAHHVHLRLLAELRLAPEYRVVEQVEIVRVELALERHVSTDVDDKLLTTWQQVVTSPRHVTVDVDHVTAGARMALDDRRRRIPNKQLVDIILVHNLRPAGHTRPATEKTTRDMIYTV